MVIRGWERENEESVFHGYRVSVWEDKDLEMDSGDGCTTICMYLMPQSCTLKHG